MATGEYRHERTWVAEAADGQLLARAVWWAFPESPEPLALDCLWVSEAVPDPVALGAELLRAAHAAFGTAPEYHLILPPGGVAAPGSVAATPELGAGSPVSPPAGLRWRLAAARDAGLGEELHRLRFEWRPGVEAAVPTPVGGARLSFAAEPRDEVFVELFRRVAEGSLDDSTRLASGSADPAQQARDTLDSYLTMPGDRSWWRIALTPDGHPAGFAIPSANGAGPVVGYLGVLPGLRGQGLADELLAEITRSHATRGAIRIRADTDAANTPMAAAFRRAGYQDIGSRIVLSAPPAAL
ncbi:N-acetyltransferase [Kitasatospora sp. MMS16-BH015]|uniref:GNAT family N-acetyltransferase n=1 Tax=Kitasatospora sp. MMS16-BH015 TaxID=2018025 RepID=UPI00131A5CF1|nr:GNAT family N-acetyltransferase [Kitasatospora sp. MMS16-BH015]